MTAYMIRHKVDQTAWLSNKFFRKNRTNNRKRWTSNYKQAAIFLNRSSAIQTMRANDINKESEIVEFELEELHVG